MVRYQDRGLEPAMADMGAKPPSELAGKQALGWVEGLEYFRWRVGYPHNMPLNGQQHI